MKHLLNIVRVVFIIILSAMLFCCQEEPVSKLMSLEIGQKHENGLIFYIFKETDPEYVSGEQHGYIVSEEIGSYTWGCENIPLSQFNVEGRYNTEIIIAQCGLNNAAGQCSVDNWWLPSIEEWELLTASNVLKTHTLNTYYWTSTKATYTEGYAIRPSDEKIEKKHVNITLKTLGIKQF